MGGREKIPFEKKLLSEPCASCDMRCCTHFSIPITAYDMARIADKLKCAPEEFCHLVDAKKIEAPPHSDAFIFDENGKLHEKVLALKKKQNGACHFFRGVMGCGIHGFHPIPCRVYPFVFGEKGRLKYNKHFVCPRIWSNGEYSKTETASLLEEFEREVKLHNRFVREWNAKHAREYAGKDAEKAFFKFLMKAAGKHA